MKKRILSVVLSIMMILSTMTCLSVATATTASAATTSQKNIVARANYLYNSTWTCKQNVYGWRNQTMFYKGYTYRMPYGQPVYSGYYIGYGVSVDTYKKAAATAGSVFYTSRSNYNGWYSTYYATDCSAYVAWTWGCNRMTTYTIPFSSTNLGYCNTTNVYKLQIGDALNSNGVGHVVLVTGLKYNSSGSLTQIEITEQTPPQLKRSYYTPSQLAYAYGSYYTIQRYNGSVPKSPDGSTSSNNGNGSGSSSTTSTTASTAALKAISTVTTKYFKKCSSSCSNLSGGFENIGLRLEWTSQCKIAAVNGISDFSGTADQNSKLLTLLKSGKLLNPYCSSNTSSTTAPTTAATSSKYYKACSSSCTTLYEGFAEVGIAQTKEMQLSIAKANGMSDYSYTAEENAELLALLKAGKLLKPTSSSSDSSSGTTTSGSNGYERGYKGGQNGTGKIYSQGLDVSYWQINNINFSKIKAAGYDYVILRCGTTKGKDSCFDSFYTQAKAAGLDVGVYYYTYATTVAGAKTDAQNTLNWIKGKKFEYPIYFDYEDSCQNNLSQSTAKNICLTYMDMLAEAGYLTGMYTGYYKSTQLPMSSICKKYEFWVAHYYDNTYTTLGSKYSTYSGMYQYSCEKYVSGMGPYDANVCYKDYPSIVKKYGFNGYTATTSSGSSSSTSTVAMPTKLATLDSNFVANIKFGKDTSKCLSVDNSTNVALYSWSTSSMKQWKFEKQSDGSYIITNVKYNKCLTVDNNSSASGANVKIAASDNSKGQRWFIYDVNGSYVFKPACGSKVVLDIYKADTADGTNVETWTYNADSAQLFKIVKTPVIPTTVANLGNSFTAQINFVKGDKNLSIYSKSNVIIYKKSDSTAQQWKFVRQSDGSYEITNVQYNQCLSVANNSADEGANVQLADDTNAKGQRWFIYKISGGYVLRPACSKTAVLDVYSGKTDDCTNVETWTYNAGTAQKFDIVKVGADATQSTTASTTTAPTTKPTTAPTTKPTTAPTEKPTEAPTSEPSTEPAEQPTEPVEEPTEQPTEPVEQPTEPEDKEVILFVPNENWKVDNARFAAYFFADGEMPVWVEATDEDEDGIYEIEIPEGKYTHIIFCRMHCSEKENKWENKWNQSGDLELGKGDKFVQHEDRWDGEGKWDKVEKPTEPVQPTETQEPTETQPSTEQTETTEPATEEAKTKVKLSKKSETVYVTGTTTIKATVTNAKGKTVYKSSNSKVATVNANGKVTAKKAGTATITVTNNGASAKFTVKVVNAKLNDADVTLKRGKTFTLKVEGQIGKATFTSSNSAIAAVNNNGKITAKKKGTAVVYVKTNGMTLKCTVRVK